MRASYICRRSGAAAANDTRHNFFFYGSVLTSGYSFEPDDQYPIQRPFNIYTGMIRITT